MLKIPKLENLDCLNVVEPEILNQDELQARYQAEIDKLLFENLSVKGGCFWSLEKDIRVFWYDIIDKLFN